MGSLPHTPAVPFPWDCSAIAKRCAKVFEDGAFWHVNGRVKRHFREEVMLAFQRLPVSSIKFVSIDAEPYISAPQMAGFIRQTGEFWVRWRREPQHVLGPSHTMFRAVHDWFGHVVPCQPFTFQGEIGAYNVHAASGMFSVETLPLVWSEVVLENAFYTYHGRWFPSYKPVSDPNWGAMELGNASMEGAADKS